MSGISAQFAGRLSCDPEVKYLPSGKPKVIFSVAVSRGRKGPDGKYKVDFTDVECFREEAITFASQNLHKGSWAMIVGNLESEQAEAEDGTMRSAGLCIAGGLNSVGLGQSDGGQ